MALSPSGIQGSGFAFHLMQRELRPGTQSLKHRDPDTKQKQANRQAESFRLPVRLTKLLGYLSLNTGPLGGKGKRLPQGIR